MQINAGKAPLLIQESITQEGVHQRTGSQKIKKWRLEKQLRFLQDHFQERGGVVITMIYECKIKKSNTSEWIVLKFDAEDKSRNFTRRATCISLLMSILSY